MLKGQQNKKYEFLFYCLIQVIACNALHGIGLGCLRACVPASHICPWTIWFCKIDIYQDLGNTPSLWQSLPFGMTFPPSPGWCLLCCYLEGSWRPVSLSQPLAGKYEDPLVCSCTVFHSHYPFILIGYYCIFLVLV